MAEVSISVRGRELELIRRSIQQLGAHIADEEVYEDAMEIYAVQDLDPVIQQNLAGDKLNRRTGQLASRTRAVLDKSGQDLTVVVESGVPYGTIQDIGGIIQPENAQWLTIPLPPAMTPAGVLKKPAKEWDNTFFQHSSAGNLILFQNLGGGSIVPLFVLKKQVEIKATHWASEAVDDTLDSLGLRINEAVARRVDKDLGNGGKKQ